MLNILSVCTRVTVLFEMSSVRDMTKCIKNCINFGNLGVFLQIQRCNLVNIIDKLSYQYLVSNFDSIKDLLDVISNALASRLLS